MVNSLTNAVQFGLRDKQNGKNFEIVVPLYSRLMAKGAGKNVKGIFGSTNWHWSLTDEGSKAFVKSFGDKVRLPALTGCAHMLRTNPALCRCL
jgi:branched-chain amino acid transport system substrate-binding protein